MADCTVMSVSIFASQTDHWLGRPPAGMARPFVTLNAKPGTLSADFAAGLRDYLASLDDETTDWRAFTTDDLLDLVTRPLQATGGKALAPAGGCGGCACPGDDCGARKQYKAAITLVRQMARRGGAVVMMPGACRATRDFGHAFHVWFECSTEHRIHRYALLHQVSAEEAGAALTTLESRQEDRLNAAFGPRSEGCGLHCHLTLNLNQFGGMPLVPIVGDTVLEWTAARNRGLRLQQAHNLRDESQGAQSAAGERIVPFPGR
jgi:hypothetical protein